MYRILIYIVFCFYSFGTVAQDLVLNEFMSLNNHTLQDEDGDYSDWIEIYNASENEIDLVGFYLSDDPEDFDKWSFPNLLIPAKGFILVFASGKDTMNAMFLHTNFKISSDGEALFLFTPSGELIDKTEPKSLQPDYSFGRITDGDGDWKVSPDPSPGASNNSMLFQQDILPSYRSGIYKSPFYLSLLSEDTLYYTANGDEPDQKSDLYTEEIYINGDFENKVSNVPTNAINYSSEDFIGKEFAWLQPVQKLNKARVIRARSYRNGTPTSKIHTFTYFTDSNKHVFPIVSLSMDSLSLFDYDYGIYVPGVHLNENDLIWTGNYYQRGELWEKPANITFFNESGDVALNENIGVRIHGQKSRMAPQKSLRIYARSQYGTPVIEYPFFEDRYYDSFRRIILRSSYTSWWSRNSLFQDDLIQMHLAQWFPNLDVQYSLPAVVYINGEYWGIQNLRERQDEYYLESIHGVNPDSLDIIQGNLVAEAGTTDDFLDLLNFIQSNDLSLQSNYEHVVSWIDVDNYIDYLIVQIYFGNMDWPGNNMKMWKSQRPGSKWRWLVYDLDATMSDYTINGLQRLYNINYPALFFREMLKSEQFKKLFVNRFVLHLNGPFKPGSMQESIDLFKSRYATEVQDHIERWGNPQSYEDWNRSINPLYEYAEYRPCAMKYMLIDFFEIEKLNYLCAHSSSENKVFLFPNPCADKLRISLEGEIESQSWITLIDSHGKQVYDGKFEDPLLEINISGIAAGVYFLKVTSGDQIYMKKLIVR